MKRPSAFSLVLLGALVVSASYFIYSAARANYFSIPEYLHLPFWYYVREYVTGILIIATPFVLVSVSLVFASRSVSVNVLTGIMILVTSYLTFAIEVKNKVKNSYDLGMLFFVNLVIFWICGVVIFLAAVIFASRNVEPRHDEKAESITTNPSVALLVVFLVIFGLYLFSDAMIGIMNHGKRGQTYGAVCFEVMSAPPNAEVWIDLASPKIEFSRFGSVPLGSKQKCSNFDLSMSPLQMRAYSATDTNRAGRSATIKDTPSEPLTVQLTDDKKTCVGIFPGAAESPTGWTAQIVDCAR